MAWHGGKINPDGSDALKVDDIKAALAMPDWPSAEAQIRRLTGDTTATVVTVKLNNAVLDALCTPPATGAK